MAYPLFTNNAATGLVSPITSSATTLYVNGGSGTLFPNPTGGNYFMLTLISSGSGNMEIVQCTARSGDTFTIVRAQEGTTAQAFAVGDAVQLRITAGSLQTFANPTVVNSVAAGTGIGVSSSTGNVTISNTGLTNLNAGSGISVSANTGSSTVANTGVLTNIAGTGISVSSATGNSTITNTGVTSITAGTNISVSASTGGITITNTMATPTNYYVGQKSQLFTSSGTFTVPSGVTAVKVTLVGGGGGGAAGYGGSNGGAGGTSSFSTLSSGGGSGATGPNNGGSNGSATGSSFAFYPTLSPIYANNAMSVVYGLGGTGVNLGGDAPVVTAWFTSLSGTVAATVGAGGSAGGGANAGQPGFVLVEW